MNTPRRPLSGLDWAAFVSAFGGAFLLTVGIGAAASGAKAFMVALGVVLLISAATMATISMRSRAAEVADRQDWQSFEASLASGVRFDVPEGMGYASELPVLLDDMGDSGEPTDGQARHAIVGEAGDIHWCAFQHQRPGGTTTVGMIGLHPERTADSYPRMRTTVKDPTGVDFDARFDIMCADSAFADRVLSDAVRVELMKAEPFSWRLEGNQLITTLDEPSNPEQQVAFIEERVDPLCRVAALIPLDA